MKHPSADFPETRRRRKTKIFSTTKILEKGGKILGGRCYMVIKPSINRWLDQADEL